MQVFINGVLLGLLLAILIGPVFFSLLQTSIVKGFKSGIWMAVGISLSDTLYIAIAYLGISKLMEQENFRILLGLAGGIIMLVFGLSSLFKKVIKRSAQVDESEKPRVFRLIMKGFLLNGINPFVLLFWIGIISMVTVNYQYSTTNAWIFFSAIIITVFATDVTKAFLANKLRDLLTNRFMLILNRVVGLALCLFSIRLFIYAYEAWMWGV